MGPTLSGLDKLLKMPTGCGEQTMILFAPNIYVLRYLTSTSQVTSGSPIKTKAIEYMKRGYQRELTFRHDDGSYSAFGKRDNSGSMWLTAFVVKSFAQARQFVFIDFAQLTTSIGWIRFKQLENGCFPQVGRVLHNDMKGGQSGAAGSLTAFVLLSMLEAGTPVEDIAVRQAVKCLDSQTISDVYTLSLLAYTYTLMDRNGRRRRVVMDILEQLTISNDGMKHWSTQSGRSDGPTLAGGEPQSSADIEVTAYILLAYITRGLASEVVPDAMPIVRWLSKQRNAYGGFSSTQDTVVALQALSKYADLLYGTNVNLVIRARGQGINKKFSVTSNNTLLLQRQAVPVPNNMMFDVEGVGCVLQQAHVKYNVYNMTGQGSHPAFLLRVTVDDIKCRKSKINICATYLGQGEASNMAVLGSKDGVRLGSRKTLTQTTARGHWT
ncbi:Alpha-2-macroglobulin-like protein 1 [Lamellibrachia satsuma]|nr:Alpha-2-macroglobulin-like protein 1 [Lamellibrachia satsuma]